VVIAGHEQDDIAILIFPDFEALRALSPDLAAASPEEIVSHGATRALFREKLKEAAAASTGSSNRVERAILLVEPPSIDGHEITDKGSINQRAVLARRAALVKELYSGTPSPRVLATAKE
jgi:feruloyl-CoA synthase